MRRDPLQVAREIVAGRFPGARAAWLGGSAIRGDATSTSDLDITVLLPGPPAPYRESTVVGDWPVELFVHTETSLAYYRDQDQQRRQPTIMRLVGESVTLVDSDGIGAGLQQECAAEVAAGPAELTTEELASLRYGVTDLLMDLEGDPPADEAAAVASLLWRSAADLLLTGARRWTGTGKGLARELRSYDAAHRTTYLPDLVDGLRCAVIGEGEPLVEVCERILEPHGGLLFDGHRLGGADPASS